VIRLLLPLAGVLGFFVLSLITVRTLRPRQPRRFFLAYALALLVVSAVVYTRLWPIASIEDALGLVAGMLAQLLACLTFWNTFYSVLWGFSGSMMYDLYNDPSLRDRERLIRSYAGDGPVDRILARRLPNLQRGGWVNVHDDRLTLTAKGRLMALGTLAAFKVFSLGMGGGVK
jgi:hypothetical protein